MEIEYQDYFSLHADWERFARWLWNSCKGILKAQTMSNDLKVNKKGNKSWSRAMQALTIMNKKNVHHWACS